MAMTASPPPELPSAANDAYIDQLDDDIAKVRAEIANLTKRRSLLSASLLSSTKVQAALQAQDTATSAPTTTANSPSTDTSPLLVAAAEHQSLHNQVNIHRLAFGITAFPFTDPSPETSDVPLLGIRFDIPSHNGKFDHAPYYLFCKKSSSSTSSTLMSSSSSSSSTLNPATNILTVHHHTIPAFVPLQGLIDKYLPAPTISSDTHSDNGGADDEGYDSHQSSADRPPSPATNDGTTNKNKQDVHALASAVYTCLTAHANRRAAIALLSDPLHASLSLMSATGEDCHFIRLIWHDGLVGRLKLNEDGFIERAVVFGDEGRMRDVERILSQDDVGNQVPVMSLRGRLDEVAKRRGREMDVDEVMSS